MIAHRVDAWPVKRAMHFTSAHHPHGGHVPPLLDETSTLGQFHRVNSDHSACPQLRFLSEFSEIEESRNRLPHWHLEQAAYFITFRLADSLPAALLIEWRRERQQWLMENPKPWSPTVETEYHKRFSTRIDHLLDNGHGSCALADARNMEFVSDTILQRNHADYVLHSWVIMPNHVHILMSPLAGKQVSPVVAGWKRFSATKIHKACGESGSLWQKDYFDRLIRDWDHFINVARYIRRNPTKAKLRAEEFLLTEAPWVKRMLS